MRHAIIVVGSTLVCRRPEPDFVLRNGEPVQVSKWFAGLKQAESARLLDDVRSLAVRVILAPVLAYRFYLRVQNIKLWSGKRPLLFVYDRGLASRIAAYAGTWGGGDVVMADLADVPPLGPTRFVLTQKGEVKLYYKRSSP